MKQVIEFIDRYKKFAVFTHLNPDGDALGSAFSLTEALRSLGKHADAVMVETPPEKYNFDEFRHLFVYCDKINIGDYDAFISVDCADLPRLGAAKNIFPQKPSLNLDHHLSNKAFADINYIVDAPATGEIIYDVVHAKKIHISPMIAMGIYIAIATDTGNFTYANTTSKVVSICSQLVRDGLDISYVANRVFNTRSFAGTMLISKFIENIRLHYDGKLALSTLMLSEMKELDAKTEDNEVLIDYARNIDTAQMAIFIRELKQDVYKVSLRSKGKINVADYAGRFGGGGHFNAAGCLMKGNLYDVLECAINTAGEYIV